MRKLLIAVAALTLCSASAWADGASLDVTAWATFTATQCSSNCTETIKTSFEYIPPDVNHIEGQIVSGSMDVTASGFLGSFSSIGLKSYYVGFLNFLGDEIDLDIPNGVGIQTGINTVYFDLYTCESQTCGGAYGQTWTGIGPENVTGQGSVVKAVEVPDETSFLSMTIISLIATIVACRLRRKGVQVVEDQACVS